MPFNKYDKAGLQDRLKAFSVPPNDVPPGKIYRDRSGHYYQKQLNGSWKRVERITPETKPETK